MEPVIIHDTQFLLTFFQQCLILMFVALSVVNTTDVNVIYMIHSFLNTSAY
jgi:hypothetical protein